MKFPHRLSKLGPFAEKVSHWPKYKPEKSRDQKRTIEQFYADLFVLGYEGPYGLFTAFPREWCRLP